ncbi:prohead protease/major capsid protein fusion protein [uncultured Roseovarius sp.]|uniref:prohead protease/major capsid protein fusion protein n=1 Tax=uncultured Roseovarius sp. TaxID=293344 RepID=UPI002594F415|nr:prohead protease/major capsid protein fusion protein [uncultured Roseovarius sp.]
MPLDDALTRATAPTSWNADERTFDAVIATTSPVTRRDAKGPYAEVLDPATLAPAAEGLPLIDSHRTSSVRDVLGRVEAVRVEGDQVIATLRLTTAADAEPVAQRIADGSLRGVSIGYRVTGWTEARGPHGRTKTPTGWSITEVTLTSNPADPNAGIRSTTHHEDSNLPEPIETQTQTPPNAEEAERTRRSEIRTLCRAANLGGETADELIDSGATVTEAKAAIFDATQERTRTAPIIRTHAVQNDDPAVINRRQADALHVRMAGGECPEDARQHMGESLLDMARDALTRAGLSTRGMTPDEVFTRAAHGTSDFPLVVSNAMGKTAAQAYQGAESPLKTLCRQRTLRDFKPSTAIRLGEMGRLEEVAENGEITHTSRAENGESMSLRTYARAINVSRNLLINDDLNLLGDMTSAFGEAAAQTEADILVDLLTGNPDLSDGTPVFDASRGNMAGAGADPSTTTLDDARKAMRTVKGLDGQTIISATPKYLLVGPELETAAEQLLASIYATTTDDVNAWAGKLSLLVEPRLAGDDWYLFADPARLACLQYGYLASAQGVQIQRNEAWTTLGMSYRAFLDFGAGWMDWRGAWYNQGAS